MINELKPTTWQRVYQSFVDDRANVSRKQLEWVRAKLQKYSCDAEPLSEPAAKTHD